MSAVLDNFPDSGARKLALLCLADHANDAGANCYPSMATIARRMCCSESQARRHVHALIDAGIVSVEPGSEQGGAGSRRYRIHVERLPPSTGATPSTDATPSADASPPLAPVRVTPCTHDTRTIKNHQLTSKAKGHVSNGHFAEFWTAYPRKVKKPRALKAFQRINPDRQCLDAMLNAIVRQSASTQWLEASGKYIPHPATWLADEQWKDEPMQSNRQPLKVAI